jgi:hypothetical protein
MATLGRLIMNETTLRYYFDDITPPLTLRSALEDIKGMKTLSAYSNFTLDLDDSYTVTIKDLIKLCDDLLDGIFEETDIKIIAFLMIASDHFCWSTDAFPGNVISEILYDWYVPEINYPITRENTAIIKDGLLFNRYDPQLLKANSRRFAG